MENNFIITNRKSTRADGLWKVNIAGEHLIGENATVYFIENCIAGATVIINKDGDEGEYIKTLIDCGSDKGEIYNYVNEQLIRKVDYKYFQRMLEEFENDAIERGKKLKAKEIADTLYLK